MQAYRPRTFALTLAPPAAKLVPPVCKTVGLPFDADVVSLDGEESGGDFDGRGHSLPGELLPATIVAEGIPFAIGPTEPGKNNTLICRGQRINLPEGKFNRAYLLAAAADGDTRGTFVVGHTAVELTIQGLSGFVGQSQSLIIGGRRVGPAHMAEPFIKRDPVAWVGTHRHTADGRNEPYVFCYLYKYGFDLPAGAEALTLPDNTGIHVFGLTLADNPNDETFAVGDLYDRILAPKISPKDEVAVSPISVAMSVDEARAEIRYTLDGNEPTAASRLYTTPIALMESAIVKARSFVDGRPDDYVACRRYTIVQPRKAAPSAAMVSGMDYRYFEGEWDRLPDFEVLEPVKTGTTDRIDLSPRLRDEHFGMEFTGFVNVPYGGVYTFTTRSDNGSRLFIGGVKVVDNESWRFLMMERCGSVALAAGCHPIKVQYFQGGGDAGLEVHYEGPGTPKHQIPRSVLYRHQSGR